MSFWVYILECADRSYYTGHTDDLEKRLAGHEQKVFKCYTSTRLPVKLVFCDEFPSREDAFARERQIKGWSRKKKQALIKKDWDKLVRLARGKKASPFDRLRVSGFL
ncbi:MAG: GIY-YIG nuclease family protein [Dehalococcoidales bacterium]|jgi:predicted GIY-YIG superfamily endonuclease